MYTLPLSKSTEVLYYNKTFFDEHNLTVPTTWDELEAVCAKIKEIDPNAIPLGYDSEANWFITMCEQYGSDYTATGDNNFLFDNETNRNFVKKFRSWYQEKLVTTEELSGGYTSALFTGESDSGTRCYMCIGSTGGATYQQPNQTNGEFEFEVGIATIPQVDADNKKVTDGSVSKWPTVTITFKGNYTGTKSADIIGKDDWLVARDVKNDGEWHVMAIDISAFNLDNLKGYKTVVKKDCTSDFKLACKIFVAYRYDIFITDNVLVGKSIG